MANSMGLVVSLAEMEQFYRGDKAGQIIELMNKTNDIMDDVLWMESNQSDGHLTRIRTGLPEVYWRRLYQGTPPSKSQWSQVKEGCGILEAIMELDVEELRLYGSRDKVFRMSEGVAFAEAMRQKVATTLFYGNSNINPDEFNGLAMPTTNYAVLCSYGDAGTANDGTFYSDQATYTTGYVNVVRRNDTRDSYPAVDSAHLFVAVFC